jgi:Uma2 family endonuclease
MQWSEVLADKSLNNLPYKIELNEYGKIIMSPATNLHGYYQSELTFLLRTLLPKGKVITECSVQTIKGVKVADVAWCSLEFLNKNSLQETPFQNAPELCIEIVSPSNSRQEMLEKISLYLGQGAIEVWLITINGAVEFFNNTGNSEQSLFNHQISTISISDLLKQ